MPTIALVEAWDIAGKKRGIFAPFRRVMDAIISKEVLVEDLLWQS